MTEENVSQETSSIFDQIKDAVVDAIKAESSATLDQIIAKIKEKLASGGVEFTEQIQGLVTEAVQEIFKQTGESLTTKVSNFMDGKKAEWVAAVMEHPNAARRQLRLFYLGIAGLCFVVGLGVGVFLL